MLAPFRVYWQYVQSFEPPPAGGLPWLQRSPAPSVGELWRLLACRRDNRVGYNFVTG